MVIQTAKQLILTANHRIKRRKRVPNLKEFSQNGQCVFLLDEELDRFLAMGVQQFHKGMRHNFYLTYCTIQIITCIQDICHS